MTYQNTWYGKLLYNSHRKNDISKHLIWKTTLQQPSQKSIHAHQSPLYYNQRRLPQLPSYQVKQKYQ